MKKSLLLRLLILFVITITLSGCIVAPLGWDDGRYYGGGYHDGDGHHDGGYYGGHGGHGGYRGGRY